MTPDPAGPTPAAWAAAATFVVDHATAEVLVAFRAAGVQAVLLKGPSIARLLYGRAEPRPYIDTDLLVRPSDVTAAGAVLDGMGYAPAFDEREMPAWWRQHASVWRSAGQGSIVDLHRTLQGVRVDPAGAWTLLSRETDTLQVAGVSAAVLSVPARLLYVALTAANDGPSGRARLDLERALQNGFEDAWREAATLAAELDATDSLYAGLSRRPEGRALAARLGLEGERSVEMGLRGVGAPREALTVDQFARARGPRERIEIMIGKLFPPATYMRSWSELARRGRLGLGLAYVHRVLWVAMKAFPAVAAWGRARRRTIPRRP
jgi:hypothetical protein